MPLNILLPMVVIGITFIVVLVHLFGYSRRFSFADDQTARDRWLREWPQDRVRSVTRCQNGEAALIDSDMGPGLVWAFGADTTTHRITGADVTRTDDGLKLNLHDFAAPSVRLHLDAAEADDWQDKLKRLTK